MYAIRSYYEDESGNPAPVNTVASGLDYPGVGPQHSYLKDIERVKYDTINDKEAIDAFMQLARLEGIIPALESAHAVAYAIKIAKDLPRITSYNVCYTKLLRLLILTRTV